MARWGTGAHARSWAGRPRWAGSRGWTKEGEEAENGRPVAQNAKSGYVGAVVGSDPLAYWTDCVVGWQVGARGWAGGQLAGYTVDAAAVATGHRTWLDSGRVGMSTRSSTRPAEPD